MKKLMLILLSALLLLPTSACKKESEPKADAPAKKEAATQADIPEGQVADPTIRTSRDWKYVLLTDGTARITGYTGNAATMVANADGMVGGSRVNTTSDKIGNALKVPSYNGKLDDFNVFAVSGWFYQTEANSGGVRRLFCSRAATTDAKTGAQKYNGWELTSPDSGAIPSGVTDTGSTYMNCYVARVTSGKTSSFTTFEAATKVQNVVNRWVHYCVVFDGAAMKAYVDGALVNEGTITDELVAANGNGFWIGRFGNRANPFVGRYDEIRMYNGVQSADRVKADYDTASAPGAFFAVTGHGRFPKPGLMIIVK